MDRLTKIVEEIAQYTRTVVTGAWRIGAALNEARELCGSDQEFGTWRKHHITEQLGIAPRTQRVFQSIARTYSLEQLPAFLGITGLADVAALPAPQQEVALKYLESAAVEGKRVPVSTTTTVVSMVKQGATFDELRTRMAPAKIPACEDVQPIAPCEPVTIDNDTQAPVDERPARRPVRPAAARQDLPPLALEEETTALARRIKKLSNGNRRDALATLLQALREQGLLVVDGATVVAEFHNHGKAIVHITGDAS